MKMRAVGNDSILEFIGSLLLAIALKEKLWRENLCLKAAMLTTKPPMPHNKLLFGKKKNFYEERLNFSALFVQHRLK
jgi:hypothetical protein